MGLMMATKLKQVVLQSTHCVRLLPGQCGCCKLKLYLAIAGSTRLVLLPLPPSSLMRGKRPKMHLLV
jgi:hypothetical protein